MRRPTLALAVLLSACAELTGVADLGIGERGRTTPADADAGGEGEGEDDRDGGGGADARTIADDASGDAAIDGGEGGAACSDLPTDETFPAAPGASWALLGSAAAAMPGVRLTPSAGGMIGALWWNAPFTFDRFEVTFAYVITTDPASTTYGPGDGLAFAWVASAATPAIDAGGGGGGLGVRGLTGWAVAVDAYTNTELSDPATPNLSIKNTVDMSTIAATAVNAALIDGKAHAVRVRLAGGSVTVALDGADVLGPTALPSYSAFTGHFGFGAGTGGAFEDHLLTRVTARIGTSGPCAAP